MARISLTGLLAILLTATTLPAQDDAAEAQRPIAERMRDIIDPVQIDGVDAERALDWWSRTTNIPLLIDWNALEREGIDRRTPITLNLRYVPAGQLLAIIMRMLPPPDAPDDAQELLYETTPWYVQLMTKRMADRQVVMRVYDVGDLLHEIPHFDDAPTMDLRESLSNTSTGAGGGGGGQGLGIFNRVDLGPDPPKSKTQRGQEIAQLIRDTVEPDIWQANGGEYASIRYFNGRLIVNAPLYVHAQIGISTVSAADRRNARRPSAVDRTWRVVKPLRADKVATVQSGDSKPIAGVERH